MNRIFTHSDLVGKVFSTYLSLDNSYGASIVKHAGSYGHERDLWELAVIKFGRDGYWNLVYDTELTDDVIGWLTNDEVKELLARIKEL